MVDKYLIFLLWIFIDFLKPNSAASLFRDGMLSKETRNGLNYVRAIGIPYLTEAIVKLNIPDVDAKTDSPIGTFGYEISNIKLHDVAIPKSNLSISQKKGLTISATNATLSIDAKWKYRQYGWPHISDSGSCVLGMDHITLQITLSVDSSDESHPKIEISESLLKIGHMKVRFHGGASWLYNVFADSITNDIKGTLERLVLAEMTSVIDKEGNKILEKFPEIISSIQRHLHEQNENEVQDKQF